MQKKIKPVALVASVLRQHSVSTCSSKSQSVLCKGFFFLTKNSSCMFFSFYLLWDNKFHFWLFFLLFWIAYLYHYHFFSILDILYWFRYLPLHKLTAHTYLSQKSIFQNIYLKILIISILCLFLITLPMLLSVE